MLKEKAVLAGAAALAAAALAPPNEDANPLEPAQTHKASRPFKFLARRFC